MTAALSHADEVDAVLGDPWDESNPAGHRAVLDADERRELFDAGEKLLDTASLNAAFVPRAEGGRLTQADRLAEVLRTVWRRDPRLGYGYGFASFLAAAGVWSTGDAGQRAWTAKLLRDRRRLAGCEQAPSPAGRSRHAAFTAERTPDGWLLTGRHEAVANLRRADALVVPARISAPGDEGGLSSFLVDRAALPEGALRYSSPPAYADADADADADERGVPVDGLVLTDCPIPRDALLGRPGQGFETSAKTARLARVLLPAAGLGALDTALRTATLLALERRVYGRAVAELPLVRTVLTGVFADLLAADALSAVALRALHTTPDQASVYAPAAGYLASRAVRDGFEQLRPVLGARSALREGRYAVFQKLAGDVAPGALGTCSSYACLIELLPQLPRPAGSAIPVQAGPPRALFDLGGQLPDLDFATLSAEAHDVDGLLGILTAPPEPGGSGAGAGAAGALGRLGRLLTGELDRLRTDCAALSPDDIGVDPSGPAFTAAGRHAVLLAAAAAWEVHRHRPALLDEPALAAVLDRLLGRLSAPGVLTEIERKEVEDHLWLELLHRVRQRRLLDLSARQVPG